MARKPRSTKNDSVVIQALNFVKLAQAAEGPVNVRHCKIASNTIVSYNGVLATGIVLTEEIPDCCPHTLNLLHALERAKGAVAITVENERMTIKTDKFKAVVECVSPVDLLYVGPDAAAYPLNNDFREALNRAAIFTREGAQTVVASSVMLRNGSVVGTNGQVIIEAWHGIATPPGLILPHTFVQALNKVDKPITRFGFSDTTFTVWFDDNSWLKTQLFIEQWPNIDMVLAYTETAKAEELPKEFWPAIEAVAPFTRDGRIVFGRADIRSHANEGEGASYTVKNLPPGQAYNVKHLLELKDVALRWDFVGNERVACFFGDKLRGAISKQHAG